MGLGKGGAVVRKGRGHSGWGACSRFLLGVVASRARTSRPSAQSRRGLRRFGEGAEAWLPAVGPPPGQRLPFMVIMRPACASFVP